MHNVRNCKMWKYIYLEKSINLVKSVIEEKTINMLEKIIPDREIIPHRTFNKFLN